MKYFVTVYQAYPIYEPAEGGYYYEGLEYDYSFRCNSLKKARRILRKMISELQDEYGDKVNEFGFSGHLWGARVKSEYIGDGTVIYIETQKGRNEKGWHPYC